MLTRDAILSCSDLPMEKVHIPEWGGDVFVRTMSGAERDKFEADIFASKGKDSQANLDNVRARLAVLTVCDEKGERIFKDSDAPMLGSKSSKALDRIYSVAVRLNGLSKEDVKELTGN